MYFTLLLSGLEYQLGNFTNNPHVHSSQKDALGSLNVHADMALVYQMCIIEDE